MKVMAKDNMTAKVKGFWTRQHTAGHIGLCILDECIRECAEQRNWDPLSRFISLSGKDRPMIGLIVRAAFGEAIEYKADKKHDTGGRIKLNFEGAFNLAGRNSYGIIAKAIEDKKSFRSPDFLKALREAVGKPEKAPKEYVQQLEDMLSYIVKKMKDAPDLVPFLKDTKKNLELAIEAQKDKEVVF
jgi:hypothetical protein